MALLGHRRRRRAASLTAASTVSRCIPSRPRRSWRAVVLGQRGSAALRPSIW